MRERMISLISKLELGEEETARVRDELGGHTPSMLKEVRRRLRPPLLLPLLLCPMIASLLIRSSAAWTIWRC